MHLKRILRESIVSISIISIFSITYAAVSQVTSGETLTAQLFNESMVPTGAVMAFNLSSCPIGWSKANGTDNALDLRGEFIRGWADDGSIDTGRGLSTWQEGTQPFSSIAGNHPYFAGDGAIAQNYDIGTQSATYTKYTNNTAKGSYGTVTKVRNSTRPRNVALLYCIKD